MSKVALEEPIFQIETAKLTKTFSYSELTRSRYAENAVENMAPAYEGLPIKLTIYPVYKLFEGVKIDAEASIGYRTKDGYSGHLDKTQLLNKDPRKPLAYLAIEDPENKWPPITKRGQTAGPFYLVWKNSGSSKISNQAWPFMLTSFKIKKTLKKVYPRIFPSYYQADFDSSIQKGFKVFLDNCFACHKLNNSGASNVGPDLNFPMSPVEYFQKAALKKFIRNPDAVRTWPSRIMYGFSEGKISETQLENLIKYFGHMSKNRPSLDNHSEAK